MRVWPLQLAHAPATLQSIGWWGDDQEESRGEREKGEKKGSRLEESKGNMRVWKLREYAEKLSRRSLINKPADERVRRKKAGGSSIRERKEKMRAGSVRAKWARI